jgi:hypothetical protein
VRCFGIIYNVYDDLRNKLIDKGIPAEQIAFIHEANTEIRKAELFGEKICFRKQDREFQMIFQLIFPWKECCKQEVRR